MSEPLLLVVDDDADLRDTLVLTLGDEGFRVIAAADGRQAQARIKAGDAPDVILLDLMMPDIDGEEMLAWLATTCPRVPVCVMSGRPRPGLRATAVLEKPVDLDVLVTTLHRLAAGAGEARPSP